MKCVTAAQTIADLGVEIGLTPDNLLPTMDNVEVFVRQAVEVGLKAIELGIAKKKYTREELRAKVEKSIYRARNVTQLLMDNDFIPAPPAE